MVNRERNTTRKAVFLIVISVVLLIGLIFFGLPLSAKLASFFSDLKTGNRVIQIVDTTPPSPPHLADLPEATNQQNLEINGTGEPQTTLVLSVNDHLFTTLIDADGNFVFSVNLDKGENIIWAKAEDSAKNTSQPSNTYTVIFDKEAPKIEISSPQNGASFYGSKQRIVNLTGSTKSGSALTVNDRLVRIYDDGTFTYPYTLSDGENILNFSVTDPAGNKTDTNLTLHYAD